MDQGKTKPGGRQSAARPAERSASGRARSFFLEQLADPGDRAQHSGGFERQEHLGGRTVGYFLQRFSKETKKQLAELLGVPMYADGSGYKFSLFQSGTKLEEIK